MQKTDNEEESRRLDMYHKRFLMFEIGSYLDEIVHIEMMEAGIDFRSYLVPLSFFMFMYFTGFLVTIPLINSIFTNEPVETVIPLDGMLDIGDAIGIPLLVIQWGFLGGLAYTSIDLLNRFLRRDLTPRVYFNASFRLILSAVAAIIVYFIYLSSGYTSIDKIPPPGILLLVFLIGIAPIQFLIHVADTYLSKIYKGWRRRSTAGNRSIIELEGINSLTAGRLSEEGIDYVQQMALSNPSEVASNTNFSFSLVNDWKEQAILYLLSGDIFIKKGDKDKQLYLYDILAKKQAIRTISPLIELWENISDNEKQDFLSSLCLSNTEWKNSDLHHLFDNIVKEGRSMKESDNTKKPDVGVNK